MKFTYIVILAWFFTFDPLTNCAQSVKCIPTGIEDVNILGGFMVGTVYKVKINCVPEDCFKNFNRNGKVILLYSNLISGPWTIAVQIPFGPKYQNSLFNSCSWFSYEHFVEENRLSDKNGSFFYKTEIIYE